MVTWLFIMNILALLRSILCWKIFWKTSLLSQTLGIHCLLVQRVSNNFISPVLLIPLFLFFFIFFFVLLPLFSVSSFFFLFFFSSSPSFLCFYSSSYLFFLPSPRDVPTKRRAKRGVGNFCRVFLVKLTLNLDHVSHSVATTSHEKIPSAFWLGSNCSIGPRVDRVHIISQLCRCLQT